MNDAETNTSSRQAAGRPLERPDTYVASRILECDAGLWRDLRATGQVVYIRWRKIVSQVCSVEGRSVENYLSGV